MTPAARLMTLFTALLLLTGCVREDNRFVPGTPGRGMTVVVAPVAGPVLPTSWPNVALELAHTTAGRLDFFGKGLDGLVGEGLPGADTTPWQAPSASLTSADVVVLVVLEAVERERLGTGPVVVVTGRVRVLDPQGREEFARPLRGVAEDIDQPKLIGPAHTPIARACSAAVADAAGQAIDYLKARGTRPQAAPTVAITLDSQPSHADVLVDGVLRGTTPCTLELPRVPTTLRLERQGHRPWERTLTPDGPLRLTPALEPSAP